MRMPFSEFITNGDLKFILVFIFFTGMAFTYFIKKLQSQRNENSIALIQGYNAKINSAAFWIITASTLSLLLGFMHSFYFIGKAGGMAPHLIFLGVSNALITPVLGVCLFIVCKILSKTLNPTSK